MTTKHIGRFEIVRELGRGAQSVVYLARDPHLQREVAIKTMHFLQPDPQQNQQLLSEARMVSQLRHASIVPIFEAGEEEGDLYLVFEYVPGKNLAEYLRESGALSPVRAIAIMHPILDALSHAHAMGIIHRDLKPTNILLSQDGMPRVMDFGISARVEAATKDAEDFTGTPAYMAPEYISHHQISEGTDVFAAGLVFYELLTGKRAIAGDNVFQVMNRIANEDILLPGDGAVALDDRIAGVLYKSLARDPLRRYPSAVQMREAMDLYLEPENLTPSADTKQSTIDFLLRRMRHKSDFPALSESVGAINKITGSERDSVAKLSNAILKDFSLTNKILRLVNSAFYRQVGGGSISTVSRAVLVLGFDAIRSIAIAVLLFDHLQNKGDAGQLKSEFLRANLAGILAKGASIKTAPRESEQIFICAMFHNLGRLLSQYYFAEESEEIRKLVQQKPGSEEAAALRVLGIGFEELGIGIARTWGFPALIVNSMRKLPAGNVRKPTTSEEQLRVLSAFANELCSVVSDAPAELRHKEIRKLSARFAESVPLSERELQLTMEKSFEEIAEFAATIQLNLQQTTFGRQIKVWAGKALNEVVDDPDTLVSERVGATDNTLPHALPAGVVARQAGEGEGAHEAGRADERPGDAEAILTAGIQDISNTLVDDFKLNDVLRIILETMYRAKGFKRVILCTRDARSNTMIGRFGYGADAMEKARLFKFPLDMKPDIFLAALSNGVDILIRDAADPKIAARLPEWFRKGVGAGTFLLFPLSIKGNPVALIYADGEYADSIILPAKELSLLRTLRNQAVLAIKQST